MYPNIILTNRLQPSAIVDDAICALCAWLLRHPDTRGERWADSPLRPRAEWGRPKKDLFNEVCVLSIDIGRHLPLSSNNYHALNALTVRDALGFTGDLADLIHIEISRAVQARKARMVLPARAQRAARAPSSRATRPRAQARPPARTARPATARRPRRPRPRRPRPRLQLRWQRRRHRRVHQPHHLAVPFR